MNFDLAGARIDCPDDGCSGIQILLDFLVKVGGIVARRNNFDREVGATLEVLVGILKACFSDEGDIRARTVWGVRR